MADQTLENQEPTPDVISPPDGDPVKEQLGDTALDSEVELAAEASRNIVEGGNV